MKSYQIISSLATYAIRIFQDPRFWVFLLSSALISLGVVADVLGQVNTPSSQIMP
ncbi:MAG: hypothetical protein R2792_07260 [Saprospiraceae bacterium]